MTTEPTYIWSKQRPTEAGWYWCKGDGESDPVAVRVQDTTQGLSVAHGGICISVEAMLRVSWCGPIPEPAEPEKPKTVDLLHALSMARALRKELWLVGQVAESLLRQPTGEAFDKLRATVKAAEDVLEGTRCLLDPAARPTELAGLNRGGGVGNTGARMNDGHSDR